MFDGHYENSMKLLLQLKALICVGVGDRLFGNPNNRFVVLSNDLLMTPSMIGYLHDCFNRFIDKANMNKSQPKQSPCKSQQCIVKQITILS